MDDYDVKKELCYIVILIAISTLTSMCSYDISRDITRTEMIQKLCSKTEYDFCVKVQQKPIYTLKNNID